MCKLANLVSLLYQIRRKMREIMVNQATSCDLKELVQKFIPKPIQFNMLAFIGECQINYVYDYLYEYYDRSTFELVGYKLQTCILDVQLIVMNIFEWCVDYLFCRCYCTSYQLQPFYMDENYYNRNHCLFVAIISHIFCNSMYVYIEKVTAT